MRAFYSDKEAVSEEVKRMNDRLEDSYTTYTLGILICLSSKKEQNHTDL